MEKKFVNNSFPVFHLILLDSFRFIESGLLKLKKQNFFIFCCNQQSLKVF